MVNRGRGRLVGMATEVIKSQDVRILDVFVFGPLFMYAGYRLAGPEWLKVAMYSAGVGTIILNAETYVATQRAKGAPDG